MSQKIDLLHASLRTVFGDVKGLDYVTSVAVDSRQVVPGALFFALPGALTDGHRYIDAAIANGAAGVVASTSFEGTLSKNVFLIHAQDVLKALQAVAKIKIAKVSPQILAITGSVGKTTTKEFTKTVLSSEKRVFAPSGNMNSQIGLALAILNEAEGSEEWFVLEMGMTHEGNIKSLVEIAPPDVALITSIHYVHAHNFSDLQAIARAKSEIFSSPACRLRLMNADSAELTTLLSSAEIPYKTFSASRASETNWSFVKESGRLSFYEDAYFACSVDDPGFPADHVYENLLAAVSAARSVGISWKGIERAIPMVSLPKKRLEFIMKAGVEFIDDSYNASEPSMLSALKTLRRVSQEKPGRSVAVLGQMRELGAHSHLAHQRVGRAALESVDLLFCLGEEAKPIYDLWQQEGRPVFWTTSFETLVEEIKNSLRKNDTVLLKGSRSNGLWRIVDEV